MRLLLAVWIMFGLMVARVIYQRKRLAALERLLEARTTSNVGGGASKELEAPPKKCDICGQLRDKNHNEVLHYKTLCRIADTNNLRSKL